MASKTFTRPKGGILREVVAFGERRVALSEHASLYASADRGLTWAPFATALSKKLAPDPARYESWYDLAARRDGLYVVTSTHVIRHPRRPRRQARARLDAPSS